MKQERLFLIISIISFVLFQGPLCPAEASNKALAEATLTAYELEATPADQPLDELPRWRSSLTEIQQAAATLLETNAKLNTEARQLKAELDALQAQVDGQRVRNAQLSDKIIEGRGKAQENKDETQIFRLKEIIAERGQQAQSQREMLALLKTRRGSLESRVALARLRVAESEVDQRARAVDAKSQDAASLNAMRAEVEALREKVARGEMQVKLLGEKTDELNSLDNPHIAQTRELSANNSGLRHRWTQLQQQKEAQQAQAERLASGKIRTEQDREGADVKKLLDARDALQVRLKDNARQLELLKKDAERQAAVGASLSSMDKLHEQNTVMEEIIGNLRENIALLEYKVSTLQRYKDRNKAGFQK